MAKETREGRRISEALLDELLAGQDPAQVFRDGSGAGGGTRPIPQDRIARVKDRGQPTTHPL